MPHRVILSLSFPRLPAEIVLRSAPDLVGQIFAVSEDLRGRQVIRSLPEVAEAAGLRCGMGLADARMICPDLISRAADPLREADVLKALRRWAGRYSPWVAEDGAAGLVADITGCAHLFGGETVLAEQLALECRDLGLTVQIGIAGTRGAAWAVARFGAAPRGGQRRGDAIDQEARATRSRAAKHSAPSAGIAPLRPAVIIPPGEIGRALGPLPIAALRLEEESIAHLARLGLARIADLAALPRAALARRFGMGVVRRLDQALGAEPEPVSPEGAPLHFGVRLSLPDPIGLEEDILAGLDKLLPALSARLKAAGRGARRLRFSAQRSDHTSQVLEIGLARPTADPARIRPLLALQVSRLEPGFGIDRLRIEAHVTEPLAPATHKGHREAVASARARAAQPEGMALHALLDRLGARLGLDALIRLAPAESHIPEKGTLQMCASFSEPAGAWPARGQPRPLRLFQPEPLVTASREAPPESFRWRRRDHRIAWAEGPERLAPEWWLDDPAWRSGVRDYWQVETEEGARLWLFHTPGAAGGGWYLHGEFA